jgi:hypothetical protein
MPTTDPAAVPFGLPEPAFKLPMLSSSTFTHSSAEWRTSAERMVMR